MPTLPTIKDAKINSLVPEKTLSATRETISKAIAKAGSNDIHIFYRKIMLLATMIQEEVKNLLIERAIPLKDVGAKISTDIGDITLVSTENYEYDENNIEKFLTKNSIPLEEVFNIGYKVVTANKKQINTLIEKGIIVEEKKFSKAKFKTLADRHPGILKYVKDLGISYTLRGL